MRINKNLSKKVTIVKKEIESVKSVGLTLYFSKIYTGYMNAGKEKNGVGFFILETIGGFSNG